MRWSGLVAMGVAVSSLAGGAPARAAAVYGDRSDMVLYGVDGGDDAEWGRIGSSGDPDDTPPTARVGVFVFRLPENAAGPVASAHLAFTVRAAYPTSAFALDLYALGARASPEPRAASDFYVGPLDASHVLVQNDLVPKSSSATGAAGTGASGDASLGAYIGNLYSAGGVGGSYLFLRLNADVATLPPADGGIDAYFAGADGEDGVLTEAGVQPILTIQFLPEPSAGILALAGIAAVVRRRPDRLKR